MATSGFLNQLDTTTNKELLPNVIDLTFKGDPALAYLRANCLDKFSGGIAWQEPFLFRVLKGSPIGYSKGDSFDVTQVQTKTGLTFDPRFYYVNASFYLEDTEVLNNGPMAVIKLADSALQEAALGMSARLSISMWRHGQNLAAENRSRAINGLSEALTTSATTTWDGNTFPNYGTVPRADVGTALDAPVTGPAMNLAGSITYDALERSYNSCYVGNEHPNIGITTNLGMSYVKLKFQPQQRFETASTVAVGFTGVKFNGAEIMQSQYCPGSAGVNDADLGNYLLSGSETFWWLNAKKPFLKLRISTSAMFGFGTTGWKPAQNNNTVANQYLFSGNLTVPGPRYHRMLFGITG